MQSTGKSNTSLKLRSFQLEDSSHILRLVESVLAEFGYSRGGHNDDWDIEDIPVFYASPESAFLVLDAGGEIVGTVGVKRRSSDEAELRRMYLKSELRGRGHGKKLLRSAVDFARLQGCETIYLETAENFEKAIGLYTSFGFALSDRPGEHSTHLVYEKSLMQAGR